MPYVWRIQMQRRMLSTLPNRYHYQARVSGQASMFSVPVNKIAALFNEMHIIDLVNASDFVGLGQPGDGPGILSGALPRVETVIEGVERITRSLGMLQARLSCQIIQVYSLLVYLHHVLRSEP
jgi:hypothetical protein